MELFNDICVMKIPSLYATLLFLSYYILSYNDGCWMGGVSWVWVLSQVMTEGKYDFRSIYEADDVTLEAEDDSPLSSLISDCDYYEPEEFNKIFLDHQVLHLCSI